jgi:hypothetical protein
VCTVVCQKLNLHKILVQGVHRFDIRLRFEGTRQEVEEPKMENARREGGISL